VGVGRQGARCCRECEHWAWAWEGVAAPPVGAVWEHARVANGKPHRHGLAMY
jgi:hypothetical protein